MIIGIPKEIKTDEYRVALIPSTIGELVAQGHEVLVETCAGQGAGIRDEDYAAAGARIAKTADEIFEQSGLIVKVKEPLAQERKRLRRGQMIFTYLHLAADLEQTNDLMNSGVTAIAYETVTDAAGKLPLLAPMSKVAGCMAPQVAAHFLERPNGGRGILLGGADDVPAAKVVILGGGTVGQNAAKIALGIGADGLPRAFDRFFRLCHFGKIGTDFLIFGKSFFSLGGYFNAMPACVSHSRCRWCSSVVHVERYRVELYPALRRVKWTG